MSEISKTADKAFGVLEALAATGPTTPQRLSAHIGINRTVVQRLLTTLVNRNFVIRAGGDYELSPRLRQLATAVEPALRRAAHPHLIRLAAETSGTLVLQVLDGHSAAVIDEVIQASAPILQARHEVGARSPLGQTASGIAILASLSDNELEQVLRNASDRGETAAKVAATRESGICRTSNELQHGVSGIAAPIRTGPGSGASIAIITPASRTNDLVGYAAQLHQAANSIEAALHG